MVTIEGVWGHTDRPWGYEIRVDYRTDDGMIVNETLMFPGEPSAQEADAHIETRRLMVEARQTATRGSRVDEPRFPEGGGLPPMMGAHGG